MTDLIRSELRKYSTTRMSWAMPLTMLLLGGLFAALQGLFLVVLGEIDFGDGQSISPAEAFPDLTVARMVYTGGFQIGYLLALVLGILSMSGEFRHKTITATLLASPRRGRLIVGKLVGLMLIVVLNALFFTAGSLIGGGSMLLAGDGPLFPEPLELTGTLLRMVLVLVLWGLIGFGLGVLIPSQVVALFVGVAGALLVEPLLGWGLSFVDALQDAARYFPSQASASTLDLYSGIDADMAQVMGSAGQLTWWAGALVLLGYAAVMTVFGWLLTSRRDVT